VTVHPTEINDILYNPGMGFADFHFGFERKLRAEEYPRATVAYFRWPWADLEPEEGHYNFELIDRTIQQAKAKGERLAFRIMCDYRRGTPKWLLEKGVGNVSVGEGTFPDFNNPVFLEYHEKLIRALGARYGRSHDIDHVDIGSVGCWGEWNTACCNGIEDSCQQYYPTKANQTKIVDWYLQSFTMRPLVMLHGDLLHYAISRGAGWRADCFGDYGYFGPRWNHMINAYPPSLSDAAVADAWKHAPVQFEICGVMQDWYDLGFDIDLILQKGLEWHVSVLNAKSSPVPEPWRERINDFQKKIGYRLVLRELSHDGSVHPGGLLHLRTSWENIGVAPPYHVWPLAYRLRLDGEAVVAQWTSEADVRRWLPGESHVVEERVTLPGDMPPGTYELDVALLDEDGKSALVNLAIAGGRADRWYALSKVDVH
jgi:hypothetical protein